MKYTPIKHRLGFFMGQNKSIIWQQMVAILPRFWCHYRPGQLGNIVDLIPNNSIYRIAINPHLSKSHVYAGGVKTKWDKDGVFLYTQPDNGRGFWWRCFSDGFYDPRKSSIYYWKNTILGNCTVLITSVEVLPIIILIMGVSAEPKLGHFAIHYESIWQI